MENLKFTANATEFFDALTALKPIARNKFIPILNYARFKDGILTATNLDSHISIEIESATVCESEPFVLDVQTIHKCLDGICKGNQVEVKLINDGNCVSIKCGENSFDTLTLPESDFPQKPVFKPESGIQFEGVDLSDILALCLASVSCEETRYYLNGIHVDSKEGNAVFVATDGHELTRVTSSYNIDSIQPNIILPSCFVKDYLRIAKKLRLKSGAKIEFAANHTRVRDGRLTIISKMIDGVFPDYTRVIPSTIGASIASCDVGKLNDAAKRFGKLSDSNAMFFEPQNDIVGISIPSMANCLTKVEFDISGPDLIDDFVTGFNPKLITGACGSIEKYSDKMSLALICAGDPTLMSPHSQPSFGNIDIVVMPMRV